MWVYAIGAVERTGEDERIVAIKIGMSGDVEKRIKAMKTHSWLPLRILAAVEFDEPFGAVNYETQLHDWFSDWRLEGEWFKWCEGSRECFIDSFDNHDRRHSLHLTSKLVGGE